MSEHDGERTREEAEQEIVLLAERIVELMREKDLLQTKLAAARTTLEEIAALGAQAFSNDNAIRMGNIAHAAWIKLGLSGETGKPASFCSRCGGKDPSCYICGSEEGKSE